MGKKIILVVITLILALMAGLPTTSLAEGIPAQKAAINGKFLPENTIILSNDLDGRFSRDFSTLLKHTRLQWVILESSTVPEDLHDKNLILLGNLASPFSGEVIREYATPEQIELLQDNPDQTLVLEVNNPWEEDRTILVCSGEYPLGIRDAAESALRALIEMSPPTSDWIQTSYEAPRDENLEAYLDQLQYTWEDEELTIQDLTMDIDAKAKNRITTQEAVEDVERLFYLLSHGYSGYGFFDQEGEFGQAKTAILEELSGKSSWSSSAFSDLIYQHLRFIADCHLTIGEYRFSEHSDFWYDTKYDLSLGIDGYQLTAKGATYTVLSINGADPDAFVYPSLNKEGNPVYRLGTLSPEQPPPLQLIGVENGEERLFEIKLKKSDFDHYSEDIFREDLLGGIPVIRVRAFGDYYRDILGEFTKTATEHRGDPALIVDIRGNGGGNESWPINWIQRLTGRRAESIFVYSQLGSKTTHMGRANAFDYWIQTGGIDTYNSDLQSHLSAAESIESGTRKPAWTGPIYPALPLIHNDTTIVIATNDQIASAGEGFILRSSQLENVVVVGENTMGCLTFGNISAHKLPNSNLMIWMPINFGLFPDQEIREGVGLAPDLWVPAQDAVNYAVAALRKGTISTALPLTQETLEAEFKPETGWTKILYNILEYWPVIAIFAVCGAVWVYFNRRNTRILVLVGLAWCLFGTYWIITNTPKAVHYGLVAVGIISLAWGLYSLFTNGWDRRSEEEGEKRVKCEE